MTNLLSLSFEQWTKRTGGDIHEWRAACELAYERMKRSEHWHGGVPCDQVATCSKRLAA